MKFGKLFKKLIAIHPEFVNLSANRCSQLTYKELRAIAKALYPNHKETLNRYIFKERDVLAQMVYITLRNL